MIFRTQQHGRTYEHQFDAKLVRKLSCLALCDDLGVVVRPGGDSRLAEPGVLISLLPLFLESADGPRRRPHNHAALMLRRETHHIQRALDVSRIYLIGVNATVTNECRKVENTGQWR